MVTSPTNDYAVTFSFSFNLLPKYKILSYSPYKVGSYGKSTMVLEGNGFNEKSKIKLAIAGQDTLQTESLTFSRFKCNASFNFTNKTKGKWDIIVNFGDTIVTLKEGLEIEEYRAPEIAVELIGPKSVRPNRFTYYTIHYKNTGNTNVYEVPIPITSTGDNSPQFDCEWTYVKPTNFSSETPPTISTIRNPKTGKITTMTIPTIPVIPPLGDGYLTIGINMNKPMDISVNSGEPMFYEDPSGKIVANQNFYDCIAGVKDIAKDKLQDWGFDIASDLIPGFDCYKSAYDFGGELGTSLAQSNGNMQLPVVGSLAWNLTKTVTECATDFVPVTKAGKVAWDLIKAAKKIEEITEDVQGTVNGVKLANTCLKALNGGKNNFIGARLVTSIDPNDKIGYRSPSGSHSFSDQRNFTYVINFENKKTATAPAQEVFITDTLDVNSFDVSSFRAGYIKIGTKVVQAPVNVQNNTWEVDMRPAMNLITRVELTLDKTKNIAHWYFKCIDPKTNDFPTDALIGFLPPNDSIGSGEGCVSFTIDLKESVKDEATVKNRASIVFDYNSAILTPTWSNKKDMVAPTSIMNPSSAAAGSTTTLSWQGTDNKGGSGVYCYNVFVKKGTSDYSSLLTRTTQTSVAFQYEKGVEYSFYVTAVDSAENKELKSKVPDITFIDRSTGVSTITKGAGQMIVYPNPSKAGNAVYLKLIYSEEALKKGRLVVTSINGSIVRTISNLSDKMIINNLNRGTYIIDLIIDNQYVSCEKIIIHWDIRK